MTSITNKTTLEGLYQAPAFLSFCQSIQKNRPRDEFSFGRSVEKENPSILSNLWSIFHITPEKTMELYKKCYIKLISEDIISEIVKYSLLNNVTGIQALACANKHFYTNITAIVGKLDLKQLCPLLQTVSAEEGKTYGFPAQPASIFPKLKLIKAYQEMAPHVEGNVQGNPVLTYFDFTLPEDLTFGKIVEIAEDQKIGVSISWDQILPTIGGLAIQQAFPCMLANNVFIDSRCKGYEDQCVLVRGHGCGLPTVEQYIIQIVLISKISNQSLCLFGKNPLTYGRSLTHVQGFPLVVGESDLARLNVYSDFGCSDKDVGAGGLRKF